VVRARSCWNSWLPSFESVGRKIGDQAFRQTDELLVQVSRQFDPADPTSPFAKQATALARQQQVLSDAMDKNHLALVGKVDELAKAVEVQKAAAAAVSRTAAADLGTSAVSITEIP